MKVHYERLGVGAHRPIRCQLSVITPFNCQLQVSEVVAEVCSPLANVALSRSRFKNGFGEAKNDEVASISKIM